MGRGVRQQPLERAVLLSGSLETFHVEVFLVHRDDHAGVQGGESAQDWSEECFDELFAGAA